MDLRRDEVLNEVKRRIEVGEDPVRIIEECRKGMTVVGDRFQNGDYFLSELLLSAEIFKQAMEIIEPYLAKARMVTSRGRIVLATLAGDIHDLGKNLFASLMKAYGFEVFDLGVDVDPVRVVEKIREVKPQFVGFSTLLSTTFDVTKMTIETFQKEGLRNQLRILVGGGIVTDLVGKYVGADFQTRDAMQGVRYCLSVSGKGR